MPHSDTDVLEDLDDIDGEEDGDDPREDLILVPDDFQPSVYMQDEYDRQDAAYTHLLNVSTFNFPLNSSWICCL